MKTSHLSRQEQVNLLLRRGLLRRWLLGCRLPGAIRFGLELSDGIGDFVGGSFNVRVGSGRFVGSLEGTSTTSPDSFTFGTGAVLRRVAGLRLAGLVWSC